jgi:hypothetical protein
MDHPPSLPDVAPYDFCLFLKLKKNTLKIQWFVDLSDIQRTVKTLLRGILENDFKDGFRQWHDRLTKENILKTTAAASAQVSKFCFHRDIPGIKLSHHVCLK